MKHIMLFLILLAAFCLRPLALGADTAADSSDSITGCGRIGESIRGENDQVVLAGITPEIQEKKRVPKPEKKKKKKDDRDDEDEDDDSSSMDDCMGDCMGDLFEAILLSICEGDDDDRTQASAVPPTPERRMEAPDRFNVFAGLIAPLDPDAEDITLWNIPGGEVLGAEVVDRIPRGARIEVLENRFFVTAEWFRVMGYEPYPFSGWILAQDVAAEVPPAPEVAEEPEPAYAAPEELAPAPPQEPTSTYAGIAAPSLDRPMWQILADFSWAQTAGQDMHEEYKHGGFRSGAMLRICPIGSFQVGLGASHSHVDGEPQYNYKITYTEGDVDSSRDIPTDSDIKILAIDLHAGQYFPFSEGYGSFTWSIGPTLFHVEESAQIHFVEFDDHNVVREDKRRDEIRKWRVGGGARLELCYLAGGQVPIGISTGISVIPWKGKYKESLTLDWIEHDAFVLFYAGLTLGYSFF